jgi:dTDP-4-dehydrorhamnose reductase
MAIKIIVTGANGQLGSEFRSLSKTASGIEFIFLTRNEFSLQHSERIAQILDDQQPQYLINCAAYTAVDKAETESDVSFTANAIAPGIIAAECRARGVRFIHISTDYVFNGQSSRPYRESDPTDPVNFYGSGKREGEQRVQTADPEAIIIRTAWVYSIYGNNFVKTMLRLMKERESINVVNDQVGTPTYAADLAAAIIDIIVKDKWQGGIYHYSNEGAISWYDFAVAIRDLSGLSCKVNPIPTTAYPTPAKRPHYSVLDKTKIRKTFQLPMIDWKTSLTKCIALLQEIQ